MRYLLAFLAVLLFFCNSPNSPTIPAPVPLIAFTIIADSTSLDYRSMMQVDSTRAGPYRVTEIYDLAKDTRMPIAAMLFGQSVVVQVVDGTLLTAKIMRRAEQSYQVVDHCVAHADSTWKIKNP